MSLRLIGIGPSNGNGMSAGLAQLNLSDAPPAFSEAVQEPPAFPNEMNAAFENLNIPAAPSAFPTADHCLAHLKLLSTFHILREDIGYTDGLFGLWDAKCEVFEGTQREETLAKMREKRWALYVARAVERFEEWWMKVLWPRAGGKRLLGKEMILTNKEFTQFPDTGRLQKWTIQMLPPIDVLMVWHSFMLNPRNYLEDCIRFGLKDTWATGLPWDVVNAAIDTSFNYNVPDVTRLDFEKWTGFSWNNIHDPLTKTLSCPRCNQQLDIPWTTCGQGEKTSADELLAMAGTGYADRDLDFLCHKCLGKVNHNLLLVAKFKKDTGNLILKDWPMGGTILSPSIGVPTAPGERDWGRYPDYFPNRLVGGHLRSAVLEIITRDNNPTMEDIKTLIETAIKDKSIVRKVNNKAAHEPSTLLPAERLSIRKMMSRYWENRSIFALELGGAVIRQGAFVDKMYGLDWLHSPTARSTMDRLLTKYSRFISIIGANPLQTAVPTLDVDLGWHTHQLSPKSYYVYTAKNCRKFIGKPAFYNCTILKTT